jgi:hypothetical protein
VSLGVTTKSQEAVSRIQADSPSLAVWPGLPRCDGPKGDVGPYPFTVKDACIVSLWAEDVPWTAVLVDALAGDHPRLHIADVGVERVTVVGELG